MQELYELLNGCCPTVDFENGEHIWTDRQIDSMDVLNIVAALEDHYEVEIDYQLLTPKHFDSAAAIMALVEQSKGNA